MKRTSESIISYNYTPNFTSSDQANLQKLLLAMQEYYAGHGRHDLPWRHPEPDGSFDAYKIMVSEIMLQQTQVPRVIPKYLAFLQEFPTLDALAAADLAVVLRAWQGLGYNRRAKFLWQAAGQAAQAGGMPQTLEGLVALPGVGHNTAGAIMAYAYNQPVVFIETNIRTVYIHHCFHDTTDPVNDKLLLPLIEQSLDRDDPRSFYWALMDYGSHLKQTVGNASVRSKHYAKQSAFHGSRRQLRGKVLRLLGAGPMTEADLMAQCEDERLPEVLQALVSEAMIRHNHNQYHLGGG
jgi:A/G-specific adenine glycosylase